MAIEKYFFGTGRRKTAIAQVRLYSGTGKVRYANQKEVKDALLVEQAKKPLELVSQDDKYDITVSLSGGGLSSQRGATLLAVSRALAKTDSEIEKTLKKEDYLTRDPREKERKKPGLKRARRAPQWAKR